MTTTLLSVMAHPDDPELWAGGVLAAHPDALIAIPRHDATRDAEAAAGAAVLGAQLLTLDAMNTDTVAQLLDQVRPDVLITHRLDDVHSDHRHAATAVLAALPPVVITTGRPARVYTCDTYNSVTLNGPVPTHTIIDVTDTWDTKMRALRCHTSQPIEDHFAPMAQTLGRLWGARVGVAFAEAFHPVPILGRLPAAPRL